MTEASELDSRRYAVTDGEIALVNLEHARRRSWDRFTRGPMLSGVAERIVEEEQLVLQFTGDVAALERLDILANALDACDPQSARTALVQAQVASATHRFTEARRHLANARSRGAPEEDVERLGLCVDQACGAQLESVLDVRRSLVEASGRLEDLVPLGAALAEMDRFDAADGAYLKALDAYDDVSPFPLAWTCFQLGQLWGELAHAPDANRAASWYRRAIHYLPQYVKARVHLSEIQTDNGELDEARALLEPALSSGDPEVPWRLADVLALQGDGDQAAFHLGNARDGFEALLAKQPLAFADHGAEFYLGSGNDPARASELARLNLANRPTARAFELYAHASDRCGGSSCPIAEHS